MDRYSGMTDGAWIKRNRKWIILFNTVWAALWFFAAIFLREHDVLVGMGIPAILFLVNGGAMVIDTWLDWRESKRMLREAEAKQTDS